MSLKSYLVVLRMESSVIFKPDEYFRVVDYPSAFGRVTLCFYTKYEDLGFDDLVPRYLVAEVRGEARSLDDAMGEFQGAASDVVISIAFCVNAKIDIPKVFIAYDDSVDIDEREFFQLHFDESYREIKTFRYSDCELISLFHEELFRAKERDRLWRAISQYHLSLNFWNTGQSVLAMEHLYICMEVLTPVMRRKICHELGIDTDGLAIKLGVEKKKLDPEIRKKYLFKGDSKTYSKSRAASDAFEHGYEEIPKVRKLAKNYCDKTASYARGAILELLELDSGLVEKATSHPFGLPLMSDEVQKYVTGWLIGKSEGLAKDGERFPYLDWFSEIDSLNINENKEFNFKTKENMTACIGQGVQFKPKSLEVWGARRTFNPGSESDT